MSIELEESYYTLREHEHVKDCDYGVGEAFTFEHNGNLWSFTVYPDQARVSLQCVWRPDYPRDESSPALPDGTWLYPRNCVKCGGGMQVGYLSADGDTWCSDKCLFTGGYTKEQYAIDYENDDCFWTEWEWEDNDLGAYTLDGVKYQLGENGWEKEAA